MSLSEYNQSSQLTTNARAQGRKLTLKVVRSLDTDRSDWMSDVVIKSSLLGPHGTLRIRWTPVDLGYQLKVMGDIKKQINSSSTPKGKTSSTSSKMGGDAGVNPEIINPPSMVKKSQVSESISGKVKNIEADSSENKYERGGTNLSGMRSMPVSFDQPRETMQTQPLASVKTEGGEKNKHEAMPTRQDREMTAIIERLRELERSHHLQITPMAIAKDKHHQGLYGLREEGVIESLIDAEFGRHKIYLHPFSNREETPTEREQRMILYDMMTTSLVHFKILFSGEAIGDTYVSVRNVMRYGAPNAMKMKS